MRQLEQQTDKVVAVLDKNNNKDKNDEPEVKKKRKATFFPDPEYFTGTDRALYGPFRAKLTAKLAIDGEALGSEYAKLWYAYGRFQGEAAIHVLPWMNKYASNMETVNEKTLADFFEYVDLVYKERNEERRAFHRILDWHTVPGRSFHQSLVEFKRLQLQVGRYGMDDLMARVCFENGIDTDMRYRMIALTGREKENFDEYCLQLLSMSDNMDELKESRRGDEEKEEERPTRRRARWISAQEMQNRRSQNRCFRCGASGHFISNCPYLPPSRR